MIGCVFMAYALKLQVGKERKNRRNNFDLPASGFPLFFNLQLQCICHEYTTNHNDRVLHMEKELSG